MFTQPPQKISSQDILVKLKQAGLIDEAGMINSQTAALFKELKVKPDIKSEPTKSSQVLPLSVAVANEHKANFALKRNLVDILTMTYPGKSLKISVVGSYISPYLTKKELAKFTSILPVYFQKPLRNLHPNNVKWALAAYNCMPREVVLSCSSGQHCYDAERLTEETISQSYRYCAQRTLTVACLSPAAIEMGALACIYIVVAPTISCIFFSEKQAQEQCNNAAPFIGNMAKVAVGIPFLKTTAQTASCSVAYIAGTIKDTFCDGIRKPSVRISLFDPAPPVITKQAVAAPSMSRDLDCKI